MHGPVNIGMSNFLASQRHWFM